MQATSAVLLSCTCVNRRVHKAEVMRLTQELRAASTGAKGGSAAAERLKKELEKTRCALLERQHLNPMRSDARHQQCHEVEQQRTLLFVVDWRSKPQMTGSMGRLMAPRGAAHNI